MTIGIAVLLVGVWSVSAIRPDTGEGGVQLGSWADEADSSDEEEDNSPLWSESLTDEPAQESPEQHHDGSALALQADAACTPPLSPVTSPRRRRSSGYQARYGTLIPELAPPGLPAGFSIGFNTSSPGFALRRHHNHEHASSDGEALGRQIRSHSESRTGKRASSLDGRAASLEVPLAFSLTHDADSSLDVAARTTTRSDDPGGDVPNPKPRT